MQLCRFIVSCFCLFGVAAGAAQDPERGRLLSGIAAIANDAIITIQDVEILAKAATRGWERLPMYQTNRALLERELFKAQSDATEQLIERRLILDDFKSSGLILPDSIIDQQIKEIMRNDYTDRANMVQTLKNEGMTVEEFRQRQKDNFILRAMEGRNVRDALIISPAKIERYYQTNLARFKLEDQVKLRGIVMNRDAFSTCDELRRRTQEIRTKIINDGVSFTEMATIYNVEPSQRRNGGDWGWHESSKLSKGIADVIAGLDAGRQSGVFSKASDGDGNYWIYFYDDAGGVTRGRKYSIKDGTETFVEEKQFGGEANHERLPALPQEFFLLKLEEKKEAHIRSLNELRDEIERDLLFQERARLRNKWVERLKAKSFVRRF